MQARLQANRTETMPRESFGELLGQLANHSAALVREEMALAKQELRESVRSLGRGVATLAIGAIIGLIALGTLAAAALALIAGIFASIGVNRLKRTTLTPEQTMETLEEDRQWLKELT
jgi:hypothetical protein